MTILKKKLDANQYNQKDQVVAINRVTKVVKGGKNMSFAALVVVGDAASGVVGIEFLRQHRHCCPFEPLASSS